MIFSLTACGVESAHLEKIAIHYWENTKDSIQVEVKSNEDIVNIFTKAVNDSKELDKKLVIKTKPLLSFDMLFSDDKKQGYHLWITSNGDGYIQNLYPSERGTFELTDNSVTKLTDFLIEKENVEVIQGDVEFEE
jgi:hypothetical protein